MTKPSVFQRSDCFDSGLIWVRSSLLRLVVLPLVAILLSTQWQSTDAFVAVVVHPPQQQPGSYSPLSFERTLVQCFATDSPAFQDEAVDKDDDDAWSLDAFQNEVTKRQQQQEEEESFDGYAFRDALFAKWGECFDVDFRRVDNFGFRDIYLNILPFKLGGRRFRHGSELDYLCHLQAVVEILEKYGQLGLVLHAIQESEKTPKMGNPIKAVPIKLDLSEEDVNKILGYF